MKTTIRLMTCAVVAAMSMEAARAALNIPSDGSDGALVITTDTVIDLSQAVTGNWDADNTANAGKGIYDANKWAVVFKYSSVTVQGGATVTFKNHASRAPVVWLVQGDVTINGTVSLDGQEGLPAPWLAEPGPGGFRGGSGYYAPGASQSTGFGPGAAAQFSYVPGFVLIAGRGGIYGSADDGRAPYGNPSLIPLLGGSGGGGSQLGPNYGGGGGGGAMLIACAETLTANGTIKATGGNSYPVVDWGSGGGSGGGIRLIAQNLAGSGSVTALGGQGGDRGSVHSYGLPGRIRLERVANSNNLQITPDPSVVSLASGATPLIWVPANGPTVKVISIGGNPAPADPLSGFGAVGADVVLPQVTTTTVVLETTNVEQASVVTVRANPRSNGAFAEATADVTEVVSADPLVLRWAANVPVKDGYSAVQVKVVRP
jgi:plastocyanin